MSTFFIPILILSSIMISKKRIPVSLLAIEVLLGLDVPLGKSRLIGVDEHPTVVALKDAFLRQKLEALPC